MTDAPVIVLVLDFDGRIRHVNPFFERLSGHRLEGVVGKSWFETCIPARDRERIREVFDRSRDGAHVSGHVNPIVTCTGEERQIEWTDGFIKDAAGQSTGILAIGLDVTARMAAEATLGDTERRLALVLDNVTDGFFTLDRNWRYVDINRSGATMVGHGPETLMGRAYLDVFPEAAGSIWERTYRQVMETGEAATAEDYYEPLDRWFEANVYPNADGITVFFRDISARKRAERVVREERDQLRQILDAQTGFVAVLSNDGTIVEVNRAPLDLLGVPRADVVGRPFWEAGWLAPGSVHAARTAIDAAARGDVWRGDIVASFPVVGARDVDAVFTPLRRSDASVRGIVAFGVDVSNRKRIERRLEQGQRLAHIGAWELDHATSRLWWSAETFRILGIDEATREPSYADYLEAVHADDRTRVDAAFQRSLEKHESYDIEHRVRTASGQVKHVRAQIRTSFDDRGTPVRSEGTLQDVSALVKAELRLHEAQRIAKLGSWELDLVTNRLDWSDEIFSIFEIDPREFGASYDAFIAAIHPDDRAAVNAAYVASVENRGAYTIVHRLLFPDGRLKWVQERGQTAYAADGRPLRSVGTVQDITDRKDADDTARRNAELLTTVVGGAPVVMFALDKQGVFRLSEGRALDKLGLRPGELVGASALETYRDVPGFTDIFARALAGEQATLTSRVGPIAFEATYTPSYDANGEIDGVIGVGFDVTDRVTAQEGLRDREARLAAVFDHASDAMTLYAVGANGVLRLVAANRISLARFSRVRESAVIGLTFVQIALDVYQRSPEELANYQTLLHRAIQTRTPVRFDDAAATSGGMIFVESTIVPILDDTGRCVLVLWSSRDATAERTAAAATRASLAEKETLLREIHHRVKNNLQVIVGLLHFQAKKHPAPEDAIAFRELRQRIMAMTLLHERLYQARDVARIDFAPYARSLVDELTRSSALGAGVQINVEAAEVTLPIEVAMPCGMIVTELVTNVLKYAFPENRGGTATVSIRRVDDRVVLGVDDNGIGFPVGFETGGGQSFGWELVRTLVLQLDGSVEATTDRGAHVRVSFDAPKADLQS